MLHQTDLVWNMPPIRELSAEEKKKKKKKGLSNIFKEVLQHGVQQMRLAAVSRA